ncbi:MAG: hypothetical protein GTN93_21405 [Anaerolineae bacterium]|nr:hypothetical protein [Anaerolineae bacterium]
MQEDHIRRAKQAFRGRIGVAKRVHAIENAYEIGGGAHYGASLCKKWAGLCRFTEDPVTCWDCKKAIEAIPASPK